MTLIQDFKENVYQATWDHGRSLFRHFLMPVIGGFILTGAIIYMVYANFLVEDFAPILEIFKEAENGSPFENQEKVEDYILNMENKARFMGIMYGVMVLLLFVGSWFTNLFLIVSENKILETPQSVMDSVKESFNKNVLRIFLAGLILTALFILLGQITQPLGGGNLGILVGLSLIIYTIMNRFLAVNSAMVHGNMSIKEAFVFSWKSVVWRRAALILGIFIAGAIIAGISYFIFAIILGAMGGIGGILFLMFVIFLLTFIASILTSVQSGIFFRYADVEVEDSGDSSDHLVEGN